MSDNSSLLLDASNPLIPVSIKSPNITVTAATKNRSNLDFLLIDEPIVVTTIIIDIVVVNISVIFMFTDLTFWKFVICSSHLFDDFLIS